MNRLYSSRNITLGGISTALIIMALFAGILTKNSKLFFLALATFFGAIPCIMTGIRGGIITFAAAAMLSFIVLPNKLYIGVYAVFGLYPIVKLFCEKHRKFIEILLKYIWFNATAFAAYFIYKNLIFIGDFFKQPIGIILIIIGAQVLFFIYDYAFTVFITFTKDKILKEV